MFLSSTAKMQPPGAGAGAECSAETSAALVQALVSGLTPTPTVVAIITIMIIITSCLVFPLIVRRALVQLVQEMLKATQSMESCYLGAVDNGRMMDRDGELKQELEKTQLEISTLREEYLRSLLSYRTEALYWLAGRAFRLLAATRRVGILRIRIEIQMEQRSRDPPQANPIAAITRRRRCQWTDHRAEVDM
ncbi:unnamed protein product [Mycena citricolor]|uniref:Uncharacterized protein n=1 Tax=Mycena citricolor TaxID=2018698 RepID=A0AAD2HWS3_9AGAR|nr:unnamed protein product [Mycena citricolor]